MTTVVFSKTSYGLWTYASDRKVTTGSGVRDFHFIDSKIKVVSDLLIGFSGSGPIENVVDYIKTHPIPVCHAPESHYINCIPTAIKSSINNIYHGRSIHAFGNIMITNTFGSDVYLYSSHGRLIRSNKSFMAIGSGSKFAYRKWNNYPGLVADMYVKYSTSRDRYSSGLYSH